jgi:hypothetical protein
LTIGAIGAGFVRSFIGIEAAPSQAIYDIFFGARDITALVCVFDTKDEVSAVAAGKQIII